MARNKSYPRAMWVGLALIVVSSLAHLWLEIDRGTRVAPQLKAGPEQIAHTYEVIATARGLERAIQDAERGQRGYLITGDTLYLDIYRRGTLEAPARLAQLKQLTLGNTEQQRRWPVLEHQVNIKLAELKRALDVRERGGFEAARLIVQASSGLDAMNAIDRVIDAAVAAEREVLAERLAGAAEFERAGRNAAFAGGVLALVVLALGVLLVLGAFRGIFKVELARQASDERFRFFVGGIKDCAIYMLDPQGHVIEWNAGAERIKGYAADEIVGQHFSRFYTEEDRAAGLPQRALETALKHGRHEEEAWRVRKNGSRFLASVLIEPLRDASGRLAGFAKITRDIDERARQQQALVQYQKMDALGQLTGGIAHDFNNLLHVIRNAAALVERRLQNIEPDVRKYLDMLKRNTDRASSLTQRLLAFSRRQVLDPKPIHPSNLVVDVTTLLEQALGESVAIETVLGAGVWWISADASQLETAILNLALNARDAMAGSGKLTIEVSNAFLDESYASSHPEVKPGQYVMIAVSDTGVGMTREVVAKAFDPFFTTKEVGQGTGLGLSQVYGFIKQSGGHAKIYSESGEGTTVKLYFPRLPGAPMAQAEAKASPLPAELGKKTVLVVEDDDDVRQFTADVLAELGYRVLTARDAASALRTLGEEPGIDLLFTDIGLPGGVNGRELADEALRRRPELKVLFTTGYTRNAVIHHGRLDPGVQLIAKPFTQSGLAQKVWQVLYGAALTAP
jgi:PAS domain S-box-containing protein